MAFRFCGRRRVSLSENGRYIFFKNASAGRVRVGPVPFRRLCRLEHAADLSAGVMKEHVRTREQAGLFDISHMKKLIEVSGGDAAALFAKLCPY